LIEIRPEARRALDEVAAFVATRAGSLPQDCAVGQILAKFADECEQLAAVLPLDEPAKVRDLV